MLPELNIKDEPARTFTSNVSALDFFTRTRIKLVSSKFVIRMYLMLALTNFPCPLLVSSSIRSISPLNGAVTILLSDSLTLEMDRVFDPPWSTPFRVMLSVIVTVAVAAVIVLAIRSFPLNSRKSNSCQKKRVILSDNPKQRGKNQATKYACNKYRN